MTGDVRLAYAEVFKERAKVIGKQRERIGPGRARRSTMASKVVAQNLKLPDKSFAHTIPIFEPRTHAMDEYHHGSLPLDHIGGCQPILLEDRHRLNRPVLACIL